MVLLRLNPATVLLLAVFIPCLLPNSLADLPPASAPSLSSFLEDPCAIAGSLASDSSLIPMDVALACQRSFPFDLDVASTTIESLLKAIEFYVFLDIAKDSPEPLLPSKVDLEDALRKIYVDATVGKFTTEYDFDMEVRRLFLSLNDAHTMYTPLCSAVWMYTPTLVLYSATQGNDLKIKIAPDRFQNDFVVESTSALVGVNLKQYYGSEVLEIDNLPALEFIKSFAESQVGLVKDFNARFNYALLFTYINDASRETFFPGQFWQQLFAPPNPTITFKIKNPDNDFTETITLPYLAYYTGKAFSSSAQYFNLNCKFQPVSPNDITSALETTQMIPNSIARFERSSLAPQPLFLGLSSSFLLEDGTTGVIVVPSFLTPGTDGYAFWGYLVLSFGIAIEQLKRRGARRIILDVTNNGGGMILAAQWMVAALFPGQPYRLPSRFRVSPLAVRMAEAANELDARGSLYHWAYWEKPASGLGFTSMDDGFFFPLTEELYGGQRSAWSQFFVDPSSGSVGLPESLVSPFGDVAPFAASDILILTNGFCGSACSILSSSLSQYYGVRTVTVGGIPGHPQQISNFPGSQIIELPDFLTQLRLLNLEDDPDAPRPLPRKTSFTFTLRQLFGPASTSYPLEFVFEPSTFNLNYTDDTALSISARWNEVSKLF